MYAQRLEEFLDNFELLSNSNFKGGVSLPELVRLFKERCKCSISAIALGSMMGRCIRNRFKKVRFQHYRCPITKTRIRWCTLQPKQHCTWASLWERPVLRHEDCSDGEKVVTRIELDDVVISDEFSLPFGSVINDSEQRRFEENTDSPNLTECTVPTERCAPLAEVEINVESESDDEFSVPFDSVINGTELQHRFEENSGSPNLTECTVPADRCTTLTEVQNDVESESDDEFSLPFDNGSDGLEENLDSLSNTGEVRCGVNKTKKCLFKSLPPLNSLAMRAYAKKRLDDAPSWIKWYLETQQVATGFDLGNRKPSFITESVRLELESNGFAVVRGVFDRSLLEEVSTFIKLKQQSEGVDENSYKSLSRERFSIGLVTKHGWTKTDYAGLAQQAITTSPNLYTCMSELYGTSRLLPNFYEYKYNFGRSSKKKDHFEFVHSDCNYPQLLFAEQLGVPVDKTYQAIVPLTSMSRETTTVYVAKGFHHHWKEATYRSLKAGHWNRGGWKTCNPLKQFLPDDARMLIEDQFVGLEAEPGDLILFSSVLPHGPNVNVTSELRIAAYPFLAPYLTNGESEASYLPNTLDSVKNSVVSGTCPKYSAHPWCKYELSKISQQFFPQLPMHQLPRSLLGDCLFGFRPWSDFESSRLAKHLFGPVSVERDNVVALVEEHTVLALRAWNDQLKQLLEVHANHLNSVGDACLLCSRMDKATLVEWWHSTDAVYHKLRDCTCSKCTEAKNFGWSLWKQQDGCTCPSCI